MTINLRDVEGAAPAAPDKTISLKRLVKICVVAAGAFVVGYAAMSMLNGVGYIMAGALGAHPTGRGNMSSQLVVGGFFAILGATIAAWRTRANDSDRGSRVRTRTVAMVLAAAVATPIVISGWRESGENADVRQQLVTAIERGGDKAMMVAD